MRRNSPVTRDPARAAPLQAHAYAAGSLALICCALAQAADPVRDPQLVRGEKVAQQVCSACHLVAKNQEFPPLLNPPAPSFIDIANRPGTSPESLQRFILTTHWDVGSVPMKMPDPMLMKPQAHAVARYIVSLKSP
jgi:mono/diheme cytochrome c family protein